MTKQTELETLNTIDQVTGGWGRGGGFRGGMGFRGGFRGPGFYGRPYYGPAYYGPAYNPYYYSNYADSAAAYYLWLQSMNQ